MESDCIVIDVGDGMSSTLGVSPAQVGQAIAALRWSCRLSPRIFSTIAGISERDLEQIEAGSFDLDILTLERICSRLGITGSELFESIENACQNFLHVVPKESEDDDSARVVLKQRLQQLAWTLRKVKRDRAILRAIRTRALEQREMCRSIKGRCADLQNKLEGQFARLSKIEIG